MCRHSCQVRLRGTMHLTLLHRRSRSAMLFLAVPIAIGCVSHAMKPAVASEPFGDIAGVVRDSASGAPIPGASVRVEGSSPIRTAPTNALGRFRLSHVSTGKHTLVLRRIGYNAKRVPVAIEAGRTRSISVSMSQPTKGARLKSCPGRILLAGTKPPTRLSNRVE
jgi:hypothetical protein